MIELKVEVTANDPGRRSQETGDIERLMTLYGADLDWDRLQEYYELFGMGDEASQLRARFANAK